MGDGEGVWNTVVVAATGVVGDAPTEHDGGGGGCADC